MLHVPQADHVTPASPPGSDHDHAPHPPGSLFYSAIMLSQVTAIPWESALLRGHPIRASAETRLVHTPIVDHAIAYDGLGRGDRLQAVLSEEVDCEGTVDRCMYFLTSGVLRCMCSERWRNHLGRN